MSNEEERGDDSSLEEAPDTEQLVNDLLRKIQVVRKHISNFIKNFNKTGKQNHTLGFAQGRRDLLNSYWSKYTELHNQILQIADDSILQQDYFANDVYSDVETSYCEKLGFLNDYITSKSTSSTPLLQSSNADNLNNLTIPPSTTSVVINQSNLPTINLPRFTGNYVEWPSFKDMFTSLIGTNNNLTDVQRLQYLKSNLGGDAEKLLKNISITEANYDCAWKILEERFENKRILVNVLLKSLMSLPSACSDSSSDLKSLLDGTIDTLKALENLGRPVKEWDDWVIYLTVQKLDSKTRLQWENSISEKEFNQISFNLLKTFLASRIRALESVAVLSDHLTSTKVRPVKLNSGIFKPERKAHVTTSKRKCPLCSTPHLLLFCPKFRKETVDERRNLVSKHKICFNCLSTEHLSTACSNSKRCKICHSKHHTMLHKDLSVRSESSSSAAASSKPAIISGQPSEFSTVSSHTASRSSDKTSVLLATAIITLRSYNGKTLRARALLDQGSEVTLMSASLLYKFNLIGQKIKIPIAGVGSTSAGVARRIVSLELLSDVEPNFVLPFKALVLPKLTSDIPMQTIQISKIQGAYIILGADVYALLLRNEVRHGALGAPTAQRTAIGWILSGTIHGQNNATSMPAQKIPACLHTLSSQDLNDQLAKFWEIEEVPCSKLITREEEECMRYFNDTTTRDPSGRYIVRLPLLSSESCLGDSRRGAVKSLQRIESHFLQNPALCKSYTEFMTEYRELKHMTEVLPQKTKTASLICYLPHHAVVRDESITTNASFKTSNGRALNDILHVGPKLQSDVLFIMLRWRKHMIAFSGDIKKMYRQILVHEDDQDMQRIVWRENADQTPKDFRLTTVTYGMSCAPYLAINTLHRLAEDEREQFPLGAAIIENGTYVDDVLSGAEDVPKALELQRQLIGLLKTAGFNLRKWAANKTEILENLEDNMRLHDPLELPLDKGVKTLGLKWHPSSDEFAFQLNLNPDKQIMSKRGVLSTIARLYDPIGWLSPVTVFLQKLWVAGLEWDTSLPDNLAADWQKFCLELRYIESIRISRWIGLHSNTLFLELHGFSDSSESAYAAAVYVRVGHNFGNIQVSLLTAKSRVAPLKRVTIPRLELCGAVLLARLIDYARKALTLNDIPVYTWTDSTTVLAWIRSHPHRWKSFVANRVSEIQTLLKGNSWRYVPTNQNPADLATRGLTASNLLDNSDLWWQGPAWLSAPSTKWPADYSLHNKEPILKEERHVKAHHTSTTMEQWDLLERYSTLKKLLRVTAYIIRFPYNSLKDRANRLLGPLSVNEIDGALKYWIKSQQYLLYGKEIIALESQNSVHPKSTILNLQPRLDNEDLLRVGGRLQNSDLAFSEKHPLILSKTSPLSALIVRDAHLATLHGGEKATCSYVLQKYWVIGLRRLTRNIIKRCIVCFKLRATACSQIMAALPKERVSPSRPFMNTGVDYAGSFSLKVSKGRGNKTFKGYAALFVCFSTKAIHLEIVSDATADAFIAAYKRFSARRGIPSTMFSDNATTFVGSSRELQRNSSKFWKQFHENVAESLSILGTQWRFIPAASPHFGGLWEANIKCVKHHLRRVIGDTILTYEEMSTVLCQIESCLNSRPLCPLSNDPTSCEALTPGHFLIGTALNNVPEPSTLNTPINRLSRWELLQNMTENFWKKWSQEYLQHLQQRSKWNESTSEPKLGDVVLVKEDRLPPSQWMLGRVVQLHPGSDGRTRVITIQSKRSLFKRPIVKICVLPIKDEHATMSS